MKSNTNRDGDSYEVEGEDRRAQEVIEAANIVAGAIVIGIVIVVASLVFSIWTGCQR
jgi:hypothetical protein